MFRIPINTKSPIIGQIMALVFGTAFSQIISILVYPFLTRLYSPEDFGVLELFVSIFTILSTIACLKYEQAIVTASNDEDAISLTAISLLISGSFSLICLILVVVFFRFFNGMSGNVLGNFLYLLPVMIFLTAFFLALRSLAIRFQYYKEITKITLIRAIIGSTTQIGFGFLKLGSFGLIFSQLLSSSASNLTFYKKVLKTGSAFNSLNINKIKALLLENINYPKFSLVATLANSLVIYGLNLIVFNLYNSSTLGQFSLANKLLSMPLMLIGGAISDVFFQKISKKYNNKEGLIGYFKKILLVLILVSIPISVVLFFILPFIFSFTFGTKWEDAGVYASIMIFLFAIRLINTPFANIFLVLRKQHVLMLSTILQLLLLGGLFLGASCFNIKIETFLIWFAATQSAFYILLLFYCWILTNEYEKTI